MPALDGMRILDMTQYEAGTVCTQMLAWLGADVVKVERPNGGDPGRNISWEGDNSPYFLNFNSNKRSICIDLQNPSGRDLLLRMVPHYDAFVENYGPGSMERLDIGYEVMREINPGIIYGRVKGFGLSGPYADYNSYDQIAQAAGGAVSVTGARDGPPIRPGATFGDSGSGVQMALAMTAAYVQKQRTGQGQLVELSMQEAVMTFMRTVIAVDSDWGRRVAPRDRNRSGPPTALYPTKPFGPNDYLYLVVLTSDQWDLLCAAISRPDLVMDPRFENDRVRRDHGDALHAEIAAWTRQRTKYEAMHELAEVGVPCTAVLDTRDFWTDPHLKARGLIQQVEHPAYGTVELMRNPLRLSDSEVALAPSPLLGQHTHEVLRADLGLSEEAIAALQECGAIA